ncbi:MAG TPA: patatin-like phospholipase family protein [Solirubrobacterales bacterium]|nr:patatin-like phospholipase family protein [Solirubrobacterales bacterium]
MDRSDKTAFVLSGGASLGAIQVGMLRALYERELEPDLIIGTSAGALNGGFIASRPQTVETADELADVWRRIGRWEVFPPNPLTGFLGFFGLKDHLVSAGSLGRIVDAEIDFDRLESAVVPFHVIATDALSGRELRLSAGPAREAVMASAALPGVFPPTCWDGRELIDGGVSNNTPISHAIELGAETVYVLPTGTACDLPEPPRGAVGMLLHAMSLLVMRRLLIEIESLKDLARLIVLPPPCPLNVSPIDFSRTEELIERGLHDARGYLEEVERGAPVPLAMTMHDHGRGTLDEPGRAGCADDAQGSPSRMAFLRPGSTISNLVRMPFSNQIRRPSG